jgi:hypothetical protein
MYCGHLALLGILFYCHLSRELIVLFSDKFLKLCSNYESAILCWLKSSIFFEQMDIDIC